MLLLLDWCPFLASMKLDGTIDRALHLLRIHQLQHRRNALL
jgi:hypothetical protein